MGHTTNWLKDEINYNEEDQKMMSLNAKMINTLFCVSNAIQFNCVLACESAKKLWTILQTTHNRTSQVKEFKIELLFHEYELFEMKLRENITYMYKRFWSLVKDLKGLGKKFETVELVKKILRF